MTNLILREGYHVLFQQNALVYTNVPTRYSTLSKMFLRWARSNIRETIVMCKFIFRRFRKGSMLGARINLLLSLLVMTKSQFFIITTFVLLAWRPVEVGLNLMVGIICFSSLSAIIYLYKYRSTDAIWAYGYSAFWFFSLSWITPYALLTLHKAGWLTRQKKIGASDGVAAQVMGINPFTAQLHFLRNRLINSLVMVSTLNMRRSRQAIRQFFSL